MAAGGHDESDEDAPTPIDRETKLAMRTAVESGDADLPAARARVERERVDDARSTFERIRALVRAMPDATERPSHDKPAFFVRGERMFAMFDDDREPTILRLAAPPGALEALTGAEPERYVAPPYLAYRGWIGVVIDDATDWDVLAGLVADAHATASAALRES